jgi:hypothetical protein
VSAVRCKQRFKKEWNTERITQHTEILWHNGIEATKALFAPALNKQHVKDAVKGFKNIMASHHNLHVAREPYNSDLTASVLQSVSTENTTKQHCTSLDTTVILRLLWELAMWLNGNGNMTA